MKKITLLIATVVILAIIPTIRLSAGDRECVLSEDVQGYCKEIGELYGICPELLMSIIEHESSGNQYAENGSCKGLMQVSVRWHSDRMEKLGVTDIYDEYGNILVATDYIAELREDYEEVSYVLDVYNGNSKATYNYENGILSVYAGSVLERSAELERLRGK